MSPRSTPTTSLRPGFVQHAAPSAIKAELERLRVKQIAIQHEIGDLERLFVVRAQQIAAGEWPANGAAS